MPKRIVLEANQGPLAGIPRIIGCLKPGTVPQQGILQLSFGDHIGMARLLRETKTYAWYREVTINEPPKPPSTAA